MSSSLCEEATERTADEQNPLNKKADAPRAHAGDMPEFVPTDEQGDCNRSPPAQACASSPSLVRELQALGHTGP
jgi:hypothetical protein